MTRRTSGTEAAKIETRTDALERRHYEISGFYEIKIYPDPGHPVSIVDPTLPIVQDGDAQFEFFINRDLAVKKLVEVEAGISVAGGSDLIIDVRNVGVSKGGNVAMLTDPIQIDAGDFASVFSAAPSAVDDSTNEVDLGEWIVIDVVSGSDGTAAGLCVYLRFD